MAFDDRLQFLLLGVAIGFVLGYTFRLLQNILEKLDKTEIKVDRVKEELDEVDEIVKGKLVTRDRGEGGFMSSRVRANIAMGVVVGLTLWASIVSQRASHNAIESQEKYDKVVSCLTFTLNNVLLNLNERSTYSEDMATANIDLQRAQDAFFAALLHEPPYTEDRRSRAARAYADALQAFLIVAQKNKAKLKNYEIPTIKDFSACLGDTEGSSNEFE